MVNDPTMTPLSILDLSPVSAGSTGAQALRNSLDLARFADGLGYVRYWVAEHHNLPSIASSAPDIMIGQIAAVTSRSRGVITVATWARNEPASIAVHESQSRLWENLVGRSRGFWTYYFPKLQQVLPAQLGQLFLLVGGEPVGALAGVDLGLLDPGPDGCLGQVEVLGPLAHRAVTLQAPLDDVSFELVGEGTTRARPGAR